MKKTITKGDKFNPDEFTILIVDDLPKNIQILGNILKNNNYNVEFATSGPQAINWLEGKNFDLMLLDVMMPEMDGFEVCKLIRAKKTHQDMPIIFLTASTDKESIIKGFSSGGQDYITKPFDTNELLARVKTHLDLRQSRKDLEMLNRLLEQKVEERTMELHKANSKLLKANHDLENLSNELLHLDSEKTEFLQLISHEIRTPLNGIKGFLGLIKLKIKDENLLKYFKYIDESSFRLEKFSMQALLITELRTRKYAIKKEIISIKDFFENVIDKHFTEQINEKGLNVLYGFKQGKTEVNADKELLVICLKSILENAIEFTGIKGSINLDAYKSQSGVIIEIDDNGPGFSDKVLKNFLKLFVPDQVYTGKGKGLDLAIVNLIMLNHEGILSISNNQNGGAKVVLQFP